MIDHTEPLGCCWQGRGAACLRAIAALALALAVLLSSAPAARATSASELPAIKAGSAPWVVDSAEVLSRSTEASLSRQLSQLAEVTGSEVRFVTLRRLDYDATIDSFADQLFAMWFPTPAAQARQVLLVLDTLTNSSAIRQGPEVPAALTEAIATSIAQETLLFPIRQDGKYNQAFLEAGDRLVAVLSGRPDPGAPQVAAPDIAATFASAEETNSKQAGLWVIGLLVAATIIPMATYFAYVGFGN